MIWLWIKSLRDKLRKHDSISHTYDIGSKEYHQQAIKEARNRTIKHIAIFPNEHFDVEYVKDKPWGAYNWYKGNGFSLIQVNIDLPFYIDKAIDWACHEGYPGHHVYHQLIDKNFLKMNNWQEYSVYQK